MAEVIANILKKIRRWMKPGSDAASGERVSRLFKFKYTCFKDLLASNTQLLDIITDFEEKLRGQEVFGMSYIRSQAARAVFHTLRMVKSLDDLSGHKYPMLFDVLEQINAAIKEELGKRKELPLTELVLPYSTITKEMVDWVGGKNANLGELLNKAHLPVPEGFAITTRAYEFFLDSNYLVDEVNRKRMDLDPTDPQALDYVSEDIQRLIISARVPLELAEAILAAYAHMSEKIKQRGDKLEETAQGSFEEQCHWRGQRALLCWAVLVNFEYPARKDHRDLQVHRGQCLHAQGHFLPPEQRNAGRRYSHERGLR